ncbi:MAG: zinc-ribbon domain-containing protein [Candidatus Aminicenantes bacterium]
MSNTCPNCLHENPDDTLFCGKCGTRFAPPEEISVLRTKTIQGPACHQQFHREIFAHAVVGGWHFVALLIGKAIRGHNLLHRQSASRCWWAKAPHQPQRP